MPQIAAGASDPTHGPNISGGAADLTSTTTTITGATSSPVVGQPITLDVGVVGGDGGTPTGTVTVSDGGTQTCVADLSGGTGSCDIAETTAGPYTFTATYNGDSSYDTSVSDGRGVTVAQDATTTSITNTTSTFVVGQPIDIAVNVAASSPGSGTPTGSVTVSDGGLQTCIANLSGGIGDCQITETAPDPYTFSGQYGGDANYEASGSTGYPVTVGQDATTTSITNTTSSFVVGQPIDIGVSVAASSPGSSTPTGTVTVSDGGLQTCVAALSDAVGDCEIAETATGPYSFTATYNGDANDDSSVSATFDVSVGKDATTTSITSTTANPVVGQPIAVDVSVGANSPGSGTPTGTVTVSDGGTQTCVAGLSGGAGSCLITETAPGPYTFSGSYSGDVDNASSVSAGAPVTVGQDGTTTTITSTTSGFVVGQPITVGVSVVANSPGSGTPTGTVKVFDGAFLHCNAHLSAGAGTCQITETAAGSYTFTAVYLGGVNDATSDSVGYDVTIGQDATTTSITSTTSSFVVGQPITIAVSVGVNPPGSGKATGKVTVSDGTQTCTAHLSSGAGSCQITETSVGDYTFTATYNGDSNNNSSVSGGYDVTVGQDGTTTSITSTTSSFVVGQTISIGVSVGADSPGGGTPTGTVTVSDGTQSCVVDLSGGTGSCQITETTAGAYTFNASYNGDGNFTSSSTSAGYGVTVGEDATTTSVTNATSSPVVGQPMTFDVNVGANAPGSGTPTGTVTVSDGTQTCVATLSGGTGSCQITETAPAYYTFSASYSGDGNYSSSVSGAAHATVTKDATTTSITSTISGFVVGQPITVGVSVVANAPGVGTPTGTVKVSDGIKNCVATLSGGTGSCQITETAAGPYTFTAGYNGDSNDAKSTSAGVPVTIGQDGTTTSITSTTSSFVAGQPISIGVSVGANAPGVGTPTGTVTVSDAGTQTCVAHLTAGTGSCQITEATVGPYTFTATYNGDSNDASSVSGGYDVTVGQDTSTTTITSTTSSFVVGQPINIAVSVVANSPGSGTPTGTVTVSDGTQSCVADLSGGSGSCQITETAPGSYSFGAAYGGDTNYSASSAAAGYGVTVGEDATTTSITSTTPTPVVGQPITIDVSVGANSPGSGTPTGTVTVSDGTQTCVAALSGGTGSCQISETTADPYTFTATYNGDANNGSSVSGGTHVTVAKDATTTSITSTTSGVVAGQPITVDVSVVANAPGSGTTTGTVKISDGAKQSCVATLSGGTGSCQITEATVGAYTFAASYNGDPNDTTSVSAGTPVTVGQDATTTSITSTTSNFVVGQPIDIGVSVGASSPGSGTPTGTATVSDGTRTCVAHLTAGTGSCQITETAVGPYTFTATYNGDANYTSSTTSVGYDVTVGQDGSTTTITSTTSSFVVGQPINIAVSVVASSPGSGIPVGKVKVSDGTQSCNANLSGGVGSCQITETTAGPYTFNASYAGDENFTASSTTAGYDVTVGEDATTTSITSTTSSPVVGQPITVDVSVGANSPGSGTPTGTVTLSDGTQQCVAALSAGSGSCNITETTAAAYTLTATYNGDLNDSSSVSAGHGVTVGKDATTTSITGTTASPAVGQPITVDVSVGANSPGSGTATGTVTVSDGGSQTCHATLSGGAGSCQITETTAGAYTFTATYGGDVNYSASSTASGTSVTVGKATSQTALSLSAPSVTYGDEQVEHISVTVSPQIAGPTPTGTVTVKESTTTVCVITLSAGKGSCTLAATQLSGGSYPIVASYNGSGDFESSASAAATLTVAKTTSRTALALSADKVTYGGEQDAHMSVTVTSSTIAGLTPTGTVTLKESTTTLCVITLSAGKGSCTLSAARLGAGTYGIAAVYSGSADFDISGTGAETFMVYAATSKTALSISPDRVTYGGEQGAHFSVTVSPGIAGVTPTGTVTVKLSTTTLCVITLSSAKGSCTLAATRLGTGTFTIVASYSGSGNFYPSGSAGESLEVFAATSRTALSLSAGSATYGGEQAEHFSVSVSPGIAGLTPAGTVTVEASGSAVCVITLSSARGSCTLSSTRLGGGSYDMVAYYHGSSDFYTSQSGGQTLTINRESSKTTLSLSATSAVYGGEQVAHLSVDVSAGDGLTPTGTVTVKTSTTTLCVLTLSSGRGSCTLSPSRLGGGSYTINSVYSGSSGFDGSTSGAWTFTVLRAISRTNLALSAAKISIGDEQVEHISVSVSPELAGSTPTGTVTVKTSTTTICVITLSSARGSCTLSPSRLGIGTYHVFATYGGSGDFDGSVSGTETLNVVYSL